MKNIAKLVFAVAVLAAPCVVNSQQTGDPKVGLCPVSPSGECRPLPNCVCLVGKPKPSFVGSFVSVVNR